MFDRFIKLHISLNLKKCIFCVPFENMMGHIVCREGVLVDSTKVVVILNIPPPMIAKQLLSNLGHIGYYRRFLRNYASIIASLEKVLKKFEAFSWKPECGQAFDTLKEKLSTDPILIYLNWNMEFHVHIDASGIALGEILAPPGERN
jgi:hypothetical protein